METQYIVWAALAILVLASLVIAYYSSKTWTVGHVVLVYLVFLMTGVFLYLAARTLKIRQVYGHQIAQFEPQLDRLQAENIKLAANIDHARHELYKLTFTRGGVWRHCQLTKAAPDGTVTLAIKQPQPHGIKKGSILIVFEEGPAGLDDQAAHYLGELKVTAVDENAHTATLQPATEMTAGDLKRMVGSKKPWSLYEVMPVDRHDLFADLDAAQLKKTIPPASLEEYLRNGKPAKDDDPDARVIGIFKDGSWAPMEVLRNNPAKLSQVVEKRYVRRLRDYDYLFRELGRQRAVDRDAIAQAQHDADQLKQALARAKKDIAAREDEKTRLTADLKGFEFERQVATHHLRAIEALAANLKAKLAAVEASNRKLASQLASLQLEAARRIDQRTGALSPRDLGRIALLAP